MITEIKLKLSDVNNFQFKHQTEFENDIKDSFARLLYLQGIEFSSIEFDFKYQLTDEDYEKGISACL